MSFSFSPNTSKLIVLVTVVGPRLSTELRCTLDTGSGLTVLPAESLRRIGFDLTRPVGHTNLRGATGIARAPLIRVPAITALDRVRTQFVVAAHDLPLGTDTDGILGLDFFRGFILKLDFIRGRISLLQKHWWHFWR
jgi:hypothetical protein